MAPGPLRTHARPSKRRRRPAGMVELHPPDRPPLRAHGGARGRTTMIGLAGSVRTPRPDGPESVDSAAVMGPIFGDEGTVRRTGFRAGRERFAGMEIPGDCRTGSRPPGAGAGQVVRKPATTLIRSGRLAGSLAGLAPSPPDMWKTPPAGSAQTAAVRRGGFRGAPLLRRQAPSGGQSRPSRPSILTATRSPASCTESRARCA